MTIEIFVLETHFSLLAFSLSWNAHLAMINILNFNNKNYRSDIEEPRRELHGGGVVIAFRGRGPSAVGGFWGQIEVCQGCFLGWLLLFVTVSEVRLDGGCWVGWLVVLHLMELWDSPSLVAELLSRWRLWWTKLFGVELVFYLKTSLTLRGGVSLIFEDFFLRLISFVYMLISLLKL